MQPKLLCIRDSRKKLSFAYVAVTVRAPQVINCLIRD
jgi:hypothetical protein